MGVIDLQLDDFPSEDVLFRQIMLTSEIVWKRATTKKDVEAWLANFNGEMFDIAYERRLALWLLANFVCYNEEEVRHLCKILFRQFLHEMLMGETNEADPLEDRVKQVLRRCRFYYLGRPSESSGLILYYFRQENNLGMKLFLDNPDNPPSHVDTLVLVDDVTLSGAQVDYYRKGMSSFMQRYKTKVLLTFFSTSDASSLVGEIGIRVISCIDLDDRCKCFSANSSVFHHMKPHLERAKSLAGHYGKRLRPEHPLGYMDGQYTFGFLYNTPDNTLPLFWSESSNWKPIMKRYDKIYREGGDHGLGRFI